MLKKFCYSTLLCAFLTPLFTQADEAKTSSNSIPIDDIRLFSEVFHQIKSNYVTDISDKKLMEYAIRGMLTNLDPHSTYLDSASFSEMEEITTGEFAGIGVEITTENGFLKVVSPIDDTPAQRAGVKAGDIIIKIDDNVIKSMNLDEGIELMRGAKGSKVKLTILRDDNAKPIELTMLRDIIKIKSVKSKIIDNQWGYLRISQFQENTGAEVKTQLMSLLSSSSNTLKGLVIDLRNNPGGILTSAIDVADLFLSNGIIVYTQGRLPESKEVYNAKPETLLNNKPIIVLINGGSASASEIVAGALQDQKRAVIAGTTSFGKGSVQIILELPEHRGMKITTARYYTPSGRSIQAEGIKPDIIIKDATITEKADETIKIKEADLTKHLKNTQENIPVDAKDNADVINDYQLQEAVNLLKAMSFSNTMKQ